MVSSFRDLAGSGVLPAETSKMNAWRCTLAESARTEAAARGSRSTSWIRTSRRVPLNVTPTSGADRAVATADMFVGLST